MDPGQQVNIYEGFEEIVIRIPFRGYRQYVAFTFIGFNVIGFVVNLWVLYVVAPLLFAPAVKVPKSILFYIFALCVSDLITMIGMLLLIIEIVFGDWQFNAFLCTAYLVFDSMNKFCAPIIVFLISRTCYATVCLDKKRRDKATSLKYAMIQVAASLTCVMLLLLPVFLYSQIYTYRLPPNNETKQVSVMRKCSFLPPEQVQMWFNLVACITSYAIPLFGIIYWYVSVPFFLKRRALSSIVSSNSSDNAIRRVVATVLVLTGIYIVCWSPYWFTMFFNDLLSRISMSQRTVVIVSYFIHLLPYISCSAYPVIFTVMNRGIKAAHSKIAQEHRRRFRSIADDAAQTLRTAIGTTTLNSLRSRMSFVVADSAKEESTRESSSPPTSQFLCVSGHASLPGRQLEDTLVAEGRKPTRQYRSSSMGTALNSPQIDIMISDYSGDLEGETLL